MHFQFIDKNGSALVLEFDPATGANLLYDNPSGILTNEPQLPVQRKLFSDLLSLPQQVRGNGAASRQAGFKAMAQFIIAYLQT